MKKPFRKDIKDLVVFDRIGYHYKRVKDYENNFYLYEMTNPEITDNMKRYELVRGKTYIQPDGSKIKTYPGSEDFGAYGWYITGSEEQCQRKISEIMERKNDSQ